MDDPSTYTGQFAKRLMRTKKMDSSNKLRLRSLHVQLGSLLVQRKALNSKVTTRHFELLREAVDEDADPYEIKVRLNRLEQSLKQEGLYKNVKADFVQLRKEILGLLQWTPGDGPKQQTLPGILGPRDRTFYVAPKNADDKDPPSGTHQTTRKPADKNGKRQKQLAGGLSADDMRLLNSAIGKLYRHLQLSQKEPELTSSEITQRETTVQKENVNVLTLSHVQPDESFHDIVLKLRNFEKEFQRQKVQQHRELRRLQEEIKRLNKISVELRKENERMKGVQPIQTKAKGKQVERLEERHRTEKKDMEDKIHVLESGMRRNFAHLLNDRDEVRAQVRTDVESLQASIDNIHNLVLGHRWDRSLYSGGDEADLLPTRDLLNMLTSVAGGIQVLKTKNTDLSRRVEELTTWRRCLKEVDREVGRFARAFSEDDEAEKTALVHETDPHNLLAQCKIKLQKTKDNINTTIKNHGDTTSIIKRKERDVIKYRKSMDELQGEICRLHEQVISVQIQDISISMPELDRRHEAGYRSDRSDGSADDLPEADRQEHMDLIDKIRQIGTLVTHFQQLIIDRTGILNKMENDMLPLKIRVNRLHEEITKAMSSPGSPEHDPADDIGRGRRAFSPDDANPNVISKEISNMLRKLSKMELSIRHLLETYASSHGRASI